MSRFVMNFRVRTVAAGDDMAKEGGKEGRHKF
jgi:hypothetical protein